MTEYLEFYRGKRVLVTGHTGFKGAWLCRILEHLGADVLGYALPPPTSPSLFDLLKSTSKTNTVLGDICDFEHLYATFSGFEPEIVLHLAAQPLVREGYRAPRGTFATNVQGTVNVLECVRKCATVRSFLNVTTDKVYLNREWEWGYRENERLCGLDPYSSSKSCSELVTYCYKHSFLAPRGVAVSTARAGNVIGGGDFAPDRIVPDCVRAALNGVPIVLRNPGATRPYQHVLEPLFAYLLIAAKGWENSECADAYNVGPGEGDCVTNAALAELFAHAWGQGLRWQAGGENGPREATYLKLDSSKIRQRLGWRPRLSIAEAVSLTVAWSRVYAEGGDVAGMIDKQILDYIKTIN